MSVEGVAIATVTANAINAAFITYWLRHEASPFTLKLKETRIHRGEMKKMLQIGVPAGIQGMVFSIANIFIQSAINHYGSNAIAGSAAALNYEVYCYLPSRRGIREPELWRRTLRPVPQSVPAVHADERGVLWSGQRHNCP